MPFPTEDVRIRTIKTVTPQGNLALAAIWIDILIAVLSIVPLLLTAHLPLADLPNHLARQYVLRDWGSSPFLQTFYQIHWDLVPNLALEFFVLAARQVMSIDMAVRAFCITTVLLLLAGARLVNRELSGHQGRIYRIAPLLCYGGPFQYGFLSYCFGIGLALLFFGLYLRLRTQPLWRLAAWLVPAGIVLMLCHLMAYGILALAVGACELAIAYATADGDWRRFPAEVLRCVYPPVVCLVPVFLLFVWLSPTADHSAVDNLVVFSNLHQRARSLVAITMLSHPKLEVALLALAVAGLVAALLTGMVRIHRIVVWAVTLLTLVWVATPQIALGAAFIDYRMPWAIALFLLAGVVPGPRYNALLVPFGAWFGALAIARVAIIAVLWMIWEPTLAAIDHALGSLPLGARLITVEGRPSGDGVFREPTLTTVHSYAVARRQAFDPGLFANMPGQTLYFQPHYSALWRQDYLGESPRTLDRLPPDYNYVLVVVPEAARVSPDLPLVCQTTGPEFELFKVVPPNQVSADGGRMGHCAG